MRILRAAHLGMCFGVRDAISLALSQREPVTVLGELVHNETVLQQLRGHGVQMAPRAEAVRTGRVMITAHGTSDAERGRLRERGHEVIEATCPLVHHAHRAVRGLVAAGYHPVIIGRRDHVEVRGLTGDLAEFDVVLSEEDLMSVRPRARFGVAAQTTQPLERVRRLVGALGQRFPESEIRLVDTVCQPTKQRQAAAEELARAADVVIVVGGAHSNNTRELVATCSRHCARVFHVQEAGELKAVWFRGDEEVVGLTAGTSTPDEVIDGVETWLRAFAEFQQQLTTKDLA